MRDYLILKSAFRKLFLAGLGNFWYEDSFVVKEKKPCYILCSVLMFAVFILMTILEILAVTVGCFPSDEKGDATTFALSHTVVLLKMFSVMLKKSSVKSLCRKLVTVCAQHEDGARMAHKYKMIKMNVVAYAVCVNMSLVSFVFEGFRKLSFGGTHFVVIVTYWPSYEDNSHFAMALRIFWTLILCLLMVPMITLDSVAVTLMISLKYKFITLRKYFENLSEDFRKLSLTASKEEASEYLHKRCVEGIAMHQELLKITKELHQSFGFMIVAQIWLSVASDISLLLTLALTPNLTFTAALKMVFFIVALLFLLSVFLCNAGEITYQASLLSDSIFYCGWHACPRASSGRNIGSIILFACANAQKPLVMKAFKMLDLTYGTFLTVVRFMYSVFALIYARHEAEPPERFQESKTLRTC